jgi:hypothetical protein
MSKEKKSKATNGRKSKHKTIIRKKKGDFKDPVEGYDEQPEK